MVVSFRGTLLLATAVQVFFKSSVAFSLTNPLHDFDITSFLDNFPSLIGELSKFNLTDVKEQLRLGDQNEDKYLNITELIVKYGYKVQTHLVQTVDGYKLTMYRIPGEGEPVLLVHGLLSHAVDWLTVGPGRALPYLLADQGYDVWLANVRGSDEASQGHVKYSANEDPEEYWNFSFDEIGRYDLPAFIDYILDTTGNSYLKYVGYSQGTLTFFVMCSERPEYNDKISLMVALSPVAWMTHFVSPIVRVLAKMGGTPSTSSVVYNGIGFYRFTPNNPIIELTTKYICGETAMAALICQNLLFAIAGFNYAQLNVTNLPVLYSHTPAAASTRQFLHVMQETNSGRFRQYDYGVVQNKIKYGSLSPPDYPVDKISAPVALFYRTTGDWLSAGEDVEILRSKLQNVVDYYNIPFDNFCHSDFIWAKDVKTLVNDRILELFKKY